MHRYILAAMVAGATPAAAQDEPRLSGTLQPVNAFGDALQGEVELTRDGNQLTISVDVRNASPGMHLAHIHGFASPEPQDAECPTEAADANGDGYIDLIETRETAGVTMIPFTDDPVSLEIHSQTYPTAGEDGQFSYSQTVDIAALEEAVRAQFDTPLALDSRVVFIHGAPEGADLPDTVASLEGVPARVTIPIACAELAPSES